MATEYATNTIDIPLPPVAAVTGGTGFIGSQVVRLLHNAGVEVRVLTIPGDPATLLADLPIARIGGDIASGAGLEQLMRGADAVFHLAAIYALWLPNRSRMFEVNVGGTRNIMAAARRAGIKRVVHTSSIAAVGYRNGKAVSDETDSFNDWELADDYVLSKYISEVEALAANGDGLDVVVVNPAFPLGHGDIGPTPTGRIVRETLRGRLPFAVKGGLNVVDVRDVAAGHVLAWRHGRAGQRYILGGDNVSNRELSSMICKLGGRSEPRFVMPTTPLRFAGQLSESVAQRVTHRAPMLTERSVAYTAGRHLFFDVSKARDELGYAPKPASEAIAASVAWFVGG